MPGEILVGQPDPISNLRPYKLYIPKDETRIEKIYRKKREEAQEFNENFWRKNNVDFNQGISELEAKAASENRAVSENDLSEYYGRYLNQQYFANGSYNLNWWKLNASMLVPGLLSSVVSLLKFKQRSDNKMIEHVSNKFMALGGEFAGGSGAHAKISAKSNSKSNSSGNSNKLVKPATSATNADEIDRRKEKIDSYY
ncbi:APOPT family protein [Smittium culicis]|uniref:APOPT family protein n=1 Tax=Smittium culicis TaxID=133412 RepID=A0A1R1YKL2_9FUNG|nr:APOPT family protein [Smittium culicis]